MFSAFGSNDINQISNDEISVFKRRNHGLFIRPFYGFFRVLKDKNEYFEIRASQIQINFICNTFSGKTAVGETGRNIFSHHQHISEKKQLLLLKPFIIICPTVPDLSPPNTVYHRQKESNTLTPRQGA